MHFEIYELRQPDVNEDGGGTNKRVGGGRNVTLTLPNGRRTTFAFSFQPGSGDGDVPCFCYEAKWAPPPGVHATLVPIDNNRLQFIPWQNTIGPYWEGVGPETPMDN